jgi:hypothetical protein
MVELYLHSPVCFYGIVLLNYIIKYKGGLLVLTGSGTCPTSFHWVARISFWKMV